MCYYNIYMTLYKKSKSSIEKFRNTRKRYIGDVGWGSDNDEDEDGPLPTPEEIEEN